MEREPTSTAAPRRLSRVAGVLLVAVLGGALAVPSCDESRAQETERKAKRVVLVVCDTLRPDRLGVYGNERGLTPHLDAFAESAVAYERAFAQSGMTMPSMGALLAGKTVDEIGLGRGNQWNLAMGVETLAERIASLGIATVAVVSNTVLKAPDPEEVGTVGIAQGFDVYDDRMESKERNRSVAERVAPDTTRAALAQVDALTSAGEDEFFLWVHYIDPHGPYTPPEPFKSRFERAHGPGAETLDLGVTNGGVGEIPAYQRLGDERRVGVYLDRYDAEVAYFDDAFGALVRGFEERELMEDTLFVVTADHGEALGEHEHWFAHGHSLAAHNVHVPLLVHFPREDDPVEDSAELEGSVVGHIDVSATILDAFGLRRPGDPRRTLFDRRRDPNAVAIHQLGVRGEGQRWIGVARGPWHLMHREGKPPRLFDLDADPREENELFDERPDVAAELLAAYARAALALESEPIPAISDDPNNRERARQLSVLGYGPGDER